MATLPDWLLEFDPDPNAWEVKGQNRFWHKTEKRQYDASDMVQAMIDKYNDDRRAEGKGIFIPGITPVPDRIKTIPAGMPREEYEEHAPPADWDVVTNRPPTAPGGSQQPSQPGGNPYLPGLDDGGMWNPTGGAAGEGLNNETAFGEGPTWDAGSGGRGQAGPIRTGMAMPFKPYGTIQDYSSEILRFGGAPRSGNQGGWKDIAQPTGLRSIGGAAPPPKAPVDVPGFTPNTYQAPTGGGGYQNITRSPQDGNTWTDPTNGQTYVWRNGKYQKRDATNRTGPVKETPVRNDGGTGTVDDPIRIEILSQILREGAR